MTSNSSEIKLPFNKINRQEQDKKPSTPSRLPVDPKSIKQTKNVALPKFSELGQDLEETKEMKKETLTPIVIKNRTLVRK